jgi:hypothetical protein
VSLTEEALALAFRSGLPFVGLRDHAHDPDLDRLIPLDAARTARAIPLTADDDHIRLAVADPDTDLSPLDQYLAGRQVDLALAPREEIDTILGPPPPPGEEPTEAAGEEPEHLASDAAEAVETEEPEQLGEAKPEPVAQPDPQSLADAEPQSLAEEAAPSEVATAGDEAVVVGPGLGQAGPEMVGAEPDGPAGASPPEAEGIGPEAVAVAAADDELAGEVPSWLEPGRGRWRRVLLAVLLVLVVLGLAAVAVVAFVNA